MGKHTKRASILLPGLRYEGKLGGRLLPSASLYSSKPAWHSWKHSSLKKNDFFYKATEDASQNTNLMRFTCISRLEAGYHRQQAFNFFVPKYTDQRNHVVPTMGIMAFIYFSNLIFILYWSIVDLQCCVSFRCAAK